MSIILTAIFDECASHFAKPGAKYYSVLHRTALGGGYIVIQRFEWENQDNAARKSLIESRLHTLETIITKKATAK
jgi:hypothetical protein